MLPTLLLFLASATGSAAPTPPPPLPLESEARKVMEAQLHAPPREGRELAPRERDTIEENYLQSIGQKPQGGNSSTGAGSSPGSGSRSM